MEDCKYFPCSLCNGLWGIKTDMCGYCGQYKPKETQENEHHDLKEDKQ